MKYRLLYVLSVLVCGCFFDRTRVGVRGSIHTMCKSEMARVFRAFDCCSRVGMNRHSVLRPTATGLRCEDVGSLNGTFVNEEKMKSPKVLKDGDVLQVGQSAIRIRVSSG